MNKGLMGLFLSLSMAAALSGCAQQAGPDVQSQGETDIPYYLDNEIATVEDLYDDRMVIVIETQYNVPVGNIADAVEAKFPDVNVLLHLQNTPDTVYYTEKSLENNTLGDIFFCAVGLSQDEEMLSRSFIDLSDAPFINNYYQNALDAVAVNGKIYALPGFSNLYGIIYDRTLLAEHGWELPGSRSEFIALCQTIQAEMGYQAFVPTLKYGRMAMLMSHAFHYQDVIAGKENQQWLRDYRQGNASFSGHMEPLFEGMKELFDAGVLSSECLTIDAGVRSAMLYKEYTSAMTMESQAAATYAATAGTEHEYGMMPFWNSDEPDSDYLISAPGFNIYVNKQLEAPEKADRLEKVMEILAYFSTPEGQAALMAEGGTSISNVKETGIASNNAFMSGVADTIAKGNIVQEVRYTDLAYNNPFQVAFREALIGYTEGSMTLDAALAHCDAAMEAVQNAEASEETVYGAASQNFTVLETAEYVADLLRHEADADIALVLARQLTYGEAGKFYEGDITDQSLKMVSLDYVSGKVPEYNQLVTVELTGLQLRSILNYPYLNNSISNTRSMWIKHDSPCYWVPSNLRLEYAPLLPENGVVSLRNMDGSDFDLKKTYTVAIWNGCFINLSETDYFDAATLAAMADVTQVSTKSSTELIKAAVLEAGTISPPDDGRFVIRWDLRPSQGT